jgi:HPt (histidine-containing phosphotransfer) domain-containing protein
MDKNWRQRVDPSFQKMLPEFEQNLRKDSMRLQTLLDQNELRTLERLAHSYKGSSGYFDLTELRELARTLEEHCQSSDKTAAALTIKAWLALLEKLEIGKE